MRLINCDLRSLRSHKSQLIMMVAVGLLAVSTAAVGAPSEPSPLFHLGDHRLDEISGIAVGIASPDVVYVQNDSGDSARFFALDRRTGTLLATYHVPGARNVDWEDIAVAPDARGTPSVWLADIGDNAATRNRIEIYRVDEPRVSRSDRDVELTSAPPQTWQLRYPDGAHDAESLAVSPSGVPYVFTKSILGDTEVFAAPASPQATDTLHKVGTIRLTFTGTPGPFAPVGQLMATGADLSRDGGRLVVRTYTDAYLWTVTGGDLARALEARPQRIPLPRQPQGEGICFDGSRLLIDSEVVGSAVYAVPLPARAATPIAPRSTSSPTQAPAAAADSGRGARAGRWWWALAGAGALALAVGMVLRRRRHG
ncbi:MAG: hypothetical protein ACRDWT_08000 [Jatrophihabitantaceae bacterium]